MENKLLYLFIFFSFCTFSLKAQEEIDSDTSKFAQFDFENNSFDFGNISQGEKVAHIFHFKNVGGAPLVFINVLTTCGCTAPEWPDQPILPMEKEQVKVVFDSSTKIGRQNKVITIRSNAKSGDYRLRISGMVLPAKKTN